MSLGTKVRRYREAKNWSQDDLALRLDVTQGTISNIESTRGFNCSFSRHCQSAEVDMNDLLVMLII
jgi:transcriptional regulator with XRE-family HTH domain